MPLKTAAEPPIAKALAKDDQMQHEIALIAKHLDPEYYLAQCPAARHSDLTLAEHYLRVGGFIGLNPTRKFSSQGYLDLHQDVNDAYVNPFLHYLQFGRDEGRTTAEPDGESQAAKSPLISYFHPSTSPQSRQLFEGLGGTAEAFSIRRPVSRTQNHSDIGPAGTPPPADTTFLEHILGLLNGATLSLDIWDTVLRRHCHPDEIKLRTARVLWLRGMRHSSALAALHPVDVFQVRRMAEQSVANAEDEYEFVHAAARWIDLLGITGHADPADLLETELMVEKLASYPDATIAELIERSNTRIICASDFYLPATALTDILQHHGLTKIAHVYASCDHGVAKRNGALFDTILNLEDVEPRAVVHVGDRTGADVTMPRQCGIKAEFYTSIWHDASSKAADRRFWSYVDGDTSRHEAALLDYLGLPEPDGETDAMPIAAMGIVAAGFGLRIIEDAHRKSVDTVFFCTREGVFFNAVYDALTDRDVFDLGTYPSAKHLHVSRRATFGPSLKAFSASELMRLWNQYSKQSLRMLATTLNIDADDWAQFARNADLSLDEVVEFPWEDERVQTLLSDQDFVDTVRKNLWAQRREVESYLDAVGLTEPTNLKTMIVDIGWRGTIQESLAEIVPGDIHGSYLGLDFFINPQPENTSKSAFLFDRNQSFDFGINEYSALEFLFNAPGGSVTGYENGKPITEQSSAEEDVITGPVAEFQREMLAIVTKVADYVRMHGLVSADLQGLARRITQHYMRRPPKQVAEAFAQLDHNETFGTGAFDDMSGHQTRIVSALDKDGSELHATLKDCQSDIRWSDAILQIPQVDQAFGTLSLDKRVHLPTSLCAPASLQAPAGSQPTILIAAPAPIAGSGGHRTIYNMARKLSELGADVHLMSEKRGDQDAQNWKDSVIVDAGLKCHDNWDASINGDAAIATIAYSAFYVRQSFSDRMQTFYFVQDNEAEFNPVSDGYLRSQNTFTQAQNHLTIGNWLSHMIALQYGRSAAAGGLGVDHAVYYRDEETERRKQIAFLYQPEKWRRAPEMCIEALALVKRQLPDTELVIYGTDKSINLPFDADFRGLITDLSELNKIYNQSTVGLCISATNPSRIPFEMMAAGCVPVDLYRYNNLFDYRSGTGLLAYQTAESIAAALVQVLSDEKHAAQRSAAGQDYVRTRTLDWETDVAANAIGMALGGSSLDSLTAPSRAYTDAPVVSATDDTAPVHRFLRWQSTLADMRIDDR